MKRIILYAIVALLAYGSTGYSVQLRYSIESGQKYRLKSVVVQDIYLNGQYYTTREGLYKNTLKTESVSNSFAVIRGDYLYFSRSVNGISAYRRANYYPSLFLRNELGTMIIGEEYYMPTVRSVPYFPEYDVEVGDSWVGKGEECHEGVVAGYAPMKFGVDVRYKLADIFTNDSDVIAEFNADYHIVYFPYSDPNVISFSGYSHSTFYWNVDKGLRDHSEEEFMFIATLRSGDSILYQGSGYTELEILRDITNESLYLLADELSTSFDGAPGIEVTPLDDGLLVNLENILFDFDDSGLKLESEYSLNRLAEFLSDYPSFDLEITGYTDNIGSEDYNLALSDMRAQNVSEYLIGQGTDATRISYIGLGSADPISDNATEEGRAQNRRVEIKIITVE